MLGGFFHSPEVQFNNLTNELQGKNHRYTHTSPYSDQEFSLDPKFRLSLGTGCQELIELSATAATEHLTKPWVPHGCISF